MHKEKNSFILYYSYRHCFNRLSVEDSGRLIRAIFDYEIDNNLPQFEDNIGLDMAFELIKPVLDSNKTKYLEKCEKNRENAKKRWSPDSIGNNEQNTDECESMQTDADYADKEIDNENVIDGEKGN